MQLTDIRIKLCESHGSQQGNRLKAFCALTIDGLFVIRDVKLIEGSDGLFLAMPSRKLCDHCGRCGEKNHLRARYCNNCGTRLDENRASRGGKGTGMSGVGHINHSTSGGRAKLYADIAHPIHSECRHEIEDRVITAYHVELKRSTMPGYVPQCLDGEDVEFVERGRPAGHISAVGIEAGGGREEAQRSPGAVAIH